MDTNATNILKDIRDRLGKVDEIEEAVIQLEQQQAGMSSNVEQKLREVRAAAWDSQGNYRGELGDEHVARGLGLFALGVIGGHREALTAFKGEFPGAYEKAMDSVSDGALIPTEFSARMHTLFEKYGVAERNAFAQPMTGDTTVFINQTGDVTVYNLTENTASSDSDPSFGNITLTAKEWGVLTFVPRTLSEDAAPEIGELIAMSIARAMAKQVDECVFNGDATSTYFGHTGIIPKLKDINGVDDGGGLVLGTGNAWSELTLTDLEKLAGTIPNYADENAKWYCHRKFFFTVIAKLVLDAGGVTATEMEGRRQLQFLGYPVELSQVMPKTEANSQVPVVFGDMRQAVTIGRRREMTVDTSRDYKFAERQLTFLGTRRIAINCHSLGSATEAGPMAGLITAAS